VTEKCDTSGTVALAFSVRITESAQASRGWARGIAVHYVLDGTRGVLTVTGPLALCVLPTGRSGECRHPDEIDSDA
jgi:hypothetical protein